MFITPHSQLGNKWREKSHPLCCSTERSVRPLDEHFWWPSENVRSEWATWRNGKRLPCLVDCLTLLYCFSTDKHPGHRGGGVRMGTTTVSIEEVRALEGKEEREESILALLGIIGTFLNLFVIVFVYIYTTL